MQKYKLVPEELSKRLGKAINFIHRRLRLLQLIPEVQDALDKKQIEIGHAELIGQMKLTQQKESLKNILEYDLTVQNFADQIMVIEVKINE